ncbi:MULTISPECIES: hypothetical protein [unclassified Roseofilum]|uniref:hypothetical protein n=1 Tax=unclassified Roseofilum TaxID=2620099 RepID=UPI001B24589D|nr:MULTISPECIES: hypothetical protein [unclassified Roseofilum]MBP0009456.1 hypothetical protein [Roseofilum sp. Belize Diploria]MBP0033923.1 hypothetical protein [Roseofilum sp. Belize BBD 4]
MTDRLANWEWRSPYIHSLIRDCPFEKFPDRGSVIDRIGVGSVENPTAIARGSPEAQGRSR